MIDVLRSIPPIVFVLIVALSITAGALVYSALTYTPPTRDERDGYEDWESETW